MQHVLKVRNLKDLLVERFITIKKEINEKGKSNESRNQCIEGIDILQLQARDLKDLIVERSIAIGKEKPRMKKSRNKLTEGIDISQGVSLFSQF